MNDIFDGSTIAVDRSHVDLERPERRSASSSTTCSSTTTRTSSRRPTTATSRATTGRASAIPVRRPGRAGLDATAQNFELQPTSPAIDAGRSEIGPLAGGNAIYPASTSHLAGGQVIGTRTDPATLPPGEVPGKSDLFGEFGGFFFNGRSSAPTIRGRS